MEGLTLSLNKYSSHYPALVKEVLLSESTEGRSSSKCASTSNGWCWLISGSQIFVWKLVEGNRSSSTQAYHMTLQRSGLPFTQDSVIIYNRGSNASPGLIVVSGEGTIRRWTPIGDVHNDTVVDIASEVVLSIQLDGSYFDGAVFVLLTTTSGSMYRIDMQEKVRDPTVTSVGSVISRGLKSRISTMIWGSTAQNNATNNRILRITVMNRPTDDVNAMIDDNDEENTVYMAISTTCITLYSPFERSVLWSVPIQQLVSHLLPSKLRGANIRGSDPLQIWGLDVIALRHGALILFGVSTSSGGVEMGLAYLDLRNNIESSPASFNSIFMLLNRPTQGIFRAHDESSFVSRVHLLMAESTQVASSMNHTDGVIILHHKCIQTVFLPESLHEKAAIRFTRTVELHANDTLLGYGSCNEYSFLIRSKSGIETVRVLPIGFDQESEESVREIEEVLNEKDDDPQFIAMFKKSLWHFVSKRISQSSAALNALLQCDNVDLPTIIHMYLQEMINSTCSSSGISADLRNKKLIFQRLILYLKNLNVYETMMESSKVIVPPFKEDVEVWEMSALLQEIAERLDVALTLATCIHKMEVRLLEDAAENASKNYGGSEGGFHNTFLAKVSSLHLVFPCLISSLRPYLSHHTHEQRIDALSAAARIMIAMSTTIKKNRASHTSISVSPTASQWTHGVIANAYLDLAECILSEMEKEGGGLSEVIKSRLKEWLTVSICFGLDEQSGRAENNKLLLRIYNMGEAQLALEMAEKFKDFRLLMLITKSMEDDERRDLLDSYKRRFADDNFELYMCNFYLKHNMMECLLEQRGERVESFMAEHESIRWRREIQTEKYDKAANSLITAATRDENTLWNQKMYASLAFLSACCADENGQDMKKVKSIADQTLTLIGHQERIPLESIAVMYPAQRQKPCPLSLDELIEVNVFECDDPNEHADGLFRALCLLGDLLNREKNHEAINALKERINEIWKRTFNNQFYQIQSIDEANRTLFVALLTRLQDSEDLGIETKTSILPSISLLKHSASDVCIKVVEQRVDTTKLILIQ